MNRTANICLCSHTLLLRRAAPVGGLLAEDRLLLQDEGDEEPQHDGGQAVTTQPPAPGSIFIPSPVRYTYSPDFTLYQMSIPLFAMICRNSEHQVRHYCQA